MDMLTIIVLLMVIAGLWVAGRVTRERYITPFLFKRLREHLPTISNTEREALEAGNTWWEKALFCGKPDWNQLFSIPRPTLINEEIDFLNNQVEQLCSMLNDWQIVHEERDLPKPVWAFLKSERFFGLVIPKEYGGHGFSALAHSTVVTKIATRSISAAVNTMVPNSLGPAELLLHYGTEEQKSYYLPRLAKGEEIPCFALTAPEAGSDASAIPDSGVVCKGIYQGLETIGIRLSWDKRYITLAPIATVLGLAFHLYDPDHFLGSVDDIGITLALLPTSHPGVEIGTRHYPLQLAFMNGPTRGKDVFIPLDWIIGGPNMAGQGWRMLMECLSIGRSISLPALATACGKVAYRNTGAYARIRQQFNTPLASFEGIEEALGNIAGYTYILEACRIMTAGAVDQKIRPSIASAIAKYHMTELARQTIEHAMDIHAGHMIQVGPRNILANLHFAMPISITVEGANILTRNLIIFGQGAIRCHPYLLQEEALLSSPNPDLKQFDRVLMGHIGYFFRNLGKNIWYGLTGGRMISATPDVEKIQQRQRQMTRMSAALALLADTSLIILGGSLKRRERISARLGDIMSQLYLASAVLKYFHDQNKPESDIEYVCWSIDYCLYKIQGACDEVLNNFPVRWVGTALSWIVFPFGRAYSAPRDEQFKKIVSSMVTSSDLRDRLTQYCYIGQDANDLPVRLDKGLNQVGHVDPIMKKIHKAIQAKQLTAKFSFSERVHAAELAGILTADEARLADEYDKLKAEIICVNEFSFNLKEVIV